MHSAPLPDGPAVARSLVADLPNRLEQPTFEHTGGLHATGLFTADGELLHTREDVGRHNAMDKVVGRALLDGLVPLGERILCVSGRLSFELVQKAAVAGAPILVGVGAPSSLAISLAEDRGLTLCGFARRGRMNVYTHPQRILERVTGALRGGQAGHPLELLLRGPRADRRADHAERGDEANDHVLLGEPLHVGLGVAATSTTPAWSGFARAPRGRARAAGRRTSPPARRRARGPTTSPPPRTPPARPASTCCGCRLESRGPGAPRPPPARTRARAADRRARRSRATGPAARRGAPRARTGSRCPPARTATSDPTRRSRRSRAPRRRRGSRRSPGPRRAAPARRSPPAPRCRRSGR